MRGLVFRFCLFTAAFDLSAGTTNYFCVVCGQIQR